ncbi:MAG TPA: diacylglycerol kinase family protein [Anaerolineales bacterium]|nr:diacylglycerol kinase family protein [Anaerolineales bacterium]
MQATVVINPNSGGAEQMEPKELIRALSEAGYEPVLLTTSSEAQLDSALDGIQGLVVSAGGDGTFRAVATRLLRKNVSLTHLPLGTANNVGHSLGIEGAALEIIAGLRDPVKRHFDVGVVTAPWGRDFFIEACGFGLYADGLAIYDPNEGRSLLRSISSIIETINEYEAHSCQMTLDGEDISGIYRMFEVMNTPRFGPWIKLAPEADPGDGLLDVVRIRPDQDESLFRYVASLLDENLDELPNVEISRGQNLEIHWPGNFPFHVDAEVHPPVSERSRKQNPATGAADPAAPSEGNIIRVEVMPQALEIWQPSTPLNDRE